MAFPVRVRASLGPAAALVAALAAPRALGAAEPPPFTTTKLANGLELVALESHKVPLVTIVLSVKAGAMTETPDIRGLTHLWEHMFFKGNARLPNQEAFNKRIRQLGIVYNGDTSAEKVRYFFTLPSVYLDEGLQFMADAIATPLLDKVELEKERRVVLDEYDRSAAQPSFDFANLERILAFGDKEYLRDPLGHRPIIENATREQLFRIKNEVFVPSNAALLVAGDFKTARLKTLVAGHFKDWHDPKGWQKVTPPKFPAWPKSVEYTMVRPNVRNAEVVLTFAGPKARTERADSFAADVLVTLLEQRTGKFYRKFVDSGLAYQAGFGYYTQSQAGEAELTATTSPEHVAEVRKLLVDEIPLMIKDDYFEPRQLEDVRRTLSLNHKREMNQPSEFVKTLAFWWAVTGLDYYNSYFDNLRKTGLPQVRGFITKYLLNKPYIAATLVSPEDAKKVGIKDTAGPLVDKYLGAYKVTKAPAPGKG
jgi:zinc protease